MDSWAVQTTFTFLLRYLSDDILKKISYMGNSNIYKALSVRTDKIFTKDLSDNISHHSVIEVMEKVTEGHDKIYGLATDSVPVLVKYHTLVHLERIYIYPLGKFTVNTK